MATNSKDKDTTVERLARIEATLDIVKDNQRDTQEEIKVMNKILAVNTEQLSVHIEGVKLAREQNEILKKDVDDRFEAMNAANEPLQDHVKFVNKLTKVAMYCLSPAAVYYIIQIGEKFLSWMHK